MKIKELIEELKKCNPDAEAFVYDYILEDCIPIKEVLDYDGSATKYTIEPDLDA